MSEETTSYSPRLRDFGPEPCHPAAARLCVLHEFTFFFLRHPGPGALELPARDEDLGLGEMGGFLIPGSVLPLCGGAYLHARPYRSRRLGRPQSGAPGEDRVPGRVIGEG